MEPKPSTPGGDARDEDSRKKTTAPRPRRPLPAPICLQPTACSLQPCGPFGPFGPSEPGPLGPSCVTFPAHFSKTYKRTSPKFSAPIRAYTRRVSPCPFSPKTAQFANRPNPCPPQALAQFPNTVCHLMSPCNCSPQGLPAGPRSEAKRNTLSPNSRRRPSRLRPAPKCKPR